jgi:hypothetical protein
LRAALLAAEAASGVLSHAHEVPVLSAGGSAAAYISYIEQLYGAALKFGDKRGYYLKIIFPKEGTTAPVSDDDKTKIASALVANYLKTSDAKYTSTSNSWAQLGFRVDTEFRTYVEGEAGIVPIASFDSFEDPSSAGTVYDVAHFGAALESMLFDWSHVDSGTAKRTALSGASRRVIVNRANVRSAPPVDTASRAVSRFVHAHLQTQCVFQSRRHARAAHLQMVR